MPYIINAYHMTVQSDRVARGRRGNPLSEHGCRMEGWGIKTASNGSLHFVKCKNILKISTICFLSKLSTIFSSKLEMSNWKDFENVCCVKHSVFQNFWAGILFIIPLNTWQTVSTIVNLFSDTYSEGQAASTRLKNVLTLSPLMVFIIFTRKPPSQQNFFYPKPLSPNIFKSKSDHSWSLL